MKIILVTFLLLITSLSFAQDSQSSYSQANQDTNASEGNQGFTGYMNKDMENEEVEFSGAVDNAGTEPNPILDVKDVKAALDLLARRPTI